MEIEIERDQVSAQVKTPGVSIIHLLPTMFSSICVIIYI